MTRLHFKDAILDELAQRHNVAQFISVGSDQVQRYSRVLGFPPNFTFGSITDGVRSLLNSSSDRAVNIRSFMADQPRSHEFIQNLSNPDEVIGHINRLSRQGLVTIVNETIDVSDGGVSGVATPHTLEFAPDSTPRAVEEEGVARLPRTLGDRVLETVYGFAPETPTGKNARLEFSIHPKPRGWLHRHTILWEREVLGTDLAPAKPTWPNKFSAFLGDKVYGLLIGWLLGLPVPYTIVTGRRFSSFSFGDNTGEFETWIRTAPCERTPGRFTTRRGWMDPFALLQAEDPEGRLIASVLSQRAVRSFYSGAAIVEMDGRLRVEGAAGAGDNFMLTGENGPIPQNVDAAVRELNKRAAEILGPVSFEWVHDGDKVWLVQLHVGRSPSQGDIIYPGEPSEWIEIPASNSLESLRSAIAHLDPARTGVVLVGSIGISSHKGDLLRKSRIPSRLRAIGDY